MKNRKGIQLNQAFGAVLTLVLVATLVIVAIYLFSNLQNGFANVSASSVNESIAMTGPVNSTVGNATSCGFSGLTVTNVINGSNYAINSGNYTVGSNSIVNTTSGYGSPWSVTYTYNWKGSACTATSATITQFAGFPTLVGLVGTIIFLGLVIGVLVASFVFGGKKGV